MINKAIIMGRLVADPEVRQTPSGVSCCQFTVAVNRDYVQQGQERQADFISVVAWRQTAEFVGKYFSKGKMIIVEGFLCLSRILPIRFLVHQHLRQGISLMSGLAVCLSKNHLKSALCPFVLQ